MSTVAEASGLTLADRAHVIEGGADRLDTIARRLFSRPYRLLENDEARQVWDEIEAKEEAA